MQRTCLHVLALTRSAMAFVRAIVNYVLLSSDSGRFVRNLTNRVQLDTKYSGLGSERIGLNWIGQAVAEELVSDRLPPDWLEWYSCTDHGKASQKVLKATARSSEMAGPKHVFKDILDRHSDVVRKDLDSVEWPSGPSPPEKKLRKVDSDGSTSGDVDSFGKALDAIFKTSEILRSAGAYKDTDTAECLCHDDAGRVVPESRRNFGLRMVSGGMTCVDFAAIGHKAGFAGKSTKPALCFMDTFVHDEIDVGILECAPGWKSDLFESRLMDSHVMHECEPKPCPSQFGWPFPRQRFWSVVLSKRFTLVKDWETFSTPFHCSPSLDGHAFFADTPAAVETLLTEKAKSHGSAVLAGEVLNFEEHALSGSQTTYLKTFREAHAKHLCTMREKAKDIPPGMHHLICDLDHNPDGALRMSTTGNMIGILIHGTVWSDKVRRPMTKCEVLSVQGFPRIPSVHGKAFPIPWAGMLLGAISHDQASQLAGNGMHMHIVVLVLCWVLACTELAVAPSTPSV